MILGINCLPLHQDKAFFSTMQNKTYKGTLLVSKSLPVVNLNSVIRLFSAKNVLYSIWTIEKFGILIMILMDR